MDIMPGVKADSFEDGAGLYLLSHFHGDHMRGLGRGWSAGPLVASEVTCRLLSEISGVDASRLRPMREGETVETGGVRVAALPANHCPGSLMFHVVDERPGPKQPRKTPRSALYTGDFRLDDAVRESLARLGEVDALFFDGTYAEGGYAFPPQEEAVRRAVEIVSAARESRTVCVAIYTIGKNRVIEAVSRARGLPVYMPDRYRRVYQLIGMGEYVTADRDATCLRGYARGYFDEHFFRQPRARRDDVLVVIPTGWANDLPDGPTWRGGAEFHYVPYSEHCDSAECAEALSLIRAGRVVMI